jgi:hypothetical protein
MFLKRPMQKSEMIYRPPYIKEERREATGGLRDTSAKGSKKSHLML